MTPSGPELFKTVKAMVPAFASDMSQPLARFMREARELCDGDLDKALIMLVIIIRANQHPDFHGLDPADVEANWSAQLPSLGTNARSIADSTGIPRESVRRKVAELVESGWVLRDGRTLHYSADGYRAVAPARDALIHMYVRAFQAVTQIIGRQSSASAREARKARMPV